MYVQFTSCVYGGAVCLEHRIDILNAESVGKEQLHIFITDRFIKNTFFCDSTHFLFYKDNFIRTKTLILAKKFQDKLRTKPGLLSQVCRLVIIKTIKNQNIRTEPVCKLDLLSQFNIAKLFHDYILLEGYTPFKFVCLLYIGIHCYTLYYGK